MVRNGLAVAAAIFVRNTLSKFEAVHLTYPVHLSKLSRTTLETQHNATLSMHIHCMFKLAEAITGLVFMHFLFSFQQATNKITMSRTK